MARAFAALAAAAAVASAAVASAAADPDTDLVRAHVAANANQTFRQPNGYIKFPYLVPGGPYNEMWDW